MKRHNAKEQCCQLQRPRLLEISSRKITKCQKAPSERINYISSMIPFMISG